jgi:hypothetical protein
MIAQVRRLDLDPMAGAIRLEGWEGRLAALVEARRHVPFQWGVNDCLMFAADAVLAVTGRDPAENHRGWYDDKGSALRHLARGHGSLWKAVEYHLGAAGNVVDARRGDIAIGTWSDDLPGMTLGVVLGAHVATPGPEGLVFNGLRTAMRAWPVGRS